MSLDSNCRLLLMFSTVKNSKCNNLSCVFCVFRVCQRICMAGDHESNRIWSPWQNIIRASCSNGAGALPVQSPWHNVPWYQQGLARLSISSRSQHSIGGRGGGSFSLQASQTTQYYVSQQRPSFFQPISVLYAPTRGGIGNGQLHTSDFTPGMNCWVGGTDSEDPLKDCATEDFQQKIKLSPREWELTKLGALYQAQGHVEAETEGHSRRPMIFTIMSYNVLAQDLINLNPDLYTLSSPQWLDWENRRRLLLAEIAYHDADILCLQEIQEDHYYDYIKHELEKLGYRGCYQKRTGDKTDGCATLWKDSRFHCLGYTPVTYSRGGLLDRDNVALIVELQPIRSQQQDKNEQQPSDPEDKLVVSNTHLLFNPRRGDIKLAQLMILLAEIDKHAYLGPASDAQQHSQSCSTTTSSDTSSWDRLEGERYCPVILTGDFNIEPYSSLYQFLVNGSLSYQGLVTKEMSGQQESWRGGSCYLQRDFFSPSFGITDLCQYYSVVVDRLRGRYHAYKFPEPHHAEKLESQGDSCDSIQGRNTEQQIYSDIQAVTKICEGEQEIAESASDKSGEKFQEADNPAEDNNKTSSEKGSDKLLHKATLSPAKHEIDGGGDTGSGFQSSPSDDFDKEKHTERADHDSDMPLMPNSSGSLSHRLNLISAYRHKIQRLGYKEDEVTTHHTQAECTVDFIFYSVDYKDVSVTDQGMEVSVVEEGHLKLLGRYGLMAGYELDSMGAIPSALFPSDHLCLLTKFLLH